MATRMKSLGMRTPPFGAARPRDRTSARPLRVPGRRPKYNPGALGTSPVSKTVQINNPGALEPRRDLPREHPGRLRRAQGHAVLLPGQSFPPEQTPSEWCGLVPAGG